MAKVVATFDTKTRELEVTVDGQKEEVINRIVFESYGYEEDGEKHYYGGMTAEHEAKKENGITYMKKALAHLCQKPVEVLMRHFKGSK